MSPTACPHAINDAMAHHFWPDSLFTGHCGAVCGRCAQLPPKAGCCRATRRQGMQLMQEPSGWRQLACFDTLSCLHSPELAGDTVQLGESKNSPMWALQHFPTPGHATVSADPCKLGGRCHSCNECAARVAEGLLRRATFLTFVPWRAVSSNQFSPFVVFACIPSPSCPEVLLIGSGPSEHGRPLTSARFAPDWRPTTAHERWQQQGVYMCPQP